MQEQRTRRPSRRSGYARCFISRRREHTKGITVSESLDVSLSRRCIRVWDRMRGGPGRKDRETRATGLQQTRVSLLHPRVDICPGIVRPRPYVCSLSGATQTLSRARDREQTKTTPLSRSLVPSLVISGSAGR